MIAPTTHAFVILTYVSIVIYRVIDLYNLDNINIGIVISGAKKITA